MLGNSDGIGYKVINEERLPNIWGNVQIFHCRDQANNTQQCKQSRCIKGTQA